MDDLNVIFLQIITWKIQFSPVVTKDHVIKEKTRILPKDENSFASIRLARLTGQLRD